MLFNKEDLLELDELDINQTSEYSNIKLIELGKWVSCPEVEKVEVIKYEWKIKK